MSTYIDLHNHILPNIDDGPSSIEESVLLARQLVKIGFSTVAVTPHSFEGLPSPAVIMKNRLELQDELDRLAIPLALLPGAELHIDPLLLQRLKFGESLTLNESRYLLLELPMFQPLPVFAEQLVKNLYREGYRPIIPHPERTTAFQQDYSLLYTFHAAGAIYQVTWGSLVGLLGDRAQSLTLFMLHHELLHIMATDAHSAASRLYSVEEAVEYLEKEVGEAMAEELLTNRPGKIIADEPLNLPEPLPPVATPKKGLLNKIFGQK